MLDQLKTGAVGELGAILRLLDWSQVRDQVEQENRARIAIIGAANVGKSTLLNQLKGWAVSTEPVQLGTADASQSENLGFFTLIDLPENTNGEGHLEGDPNWGTLLTADLVLFLFDAVVGLRRSDYEWYSRVRAAGKPIIAVLNKCDQVSDLPGLMATLGRQLGSEVVPISAKYGTDIRTLLLPRIVETQPALATALGREVVEYRCDAAGRIVRRAAILSALIGGEPIPLLDIPFQAVTQAQMILRIAAIYGQPTGDRYSRELLVTFAGSVLLRYTAQQLAKLVPLGGFLISAGVAGAGTWSLGQAAMVYFERRADQGRLGDPTHAFQSPPLRRRDTVYKFFTRTRERTKEKMEWLLKTFSENFNRVRQRFPHRVRR